MTCPDCGSNRRLGVEEPSIYDGLLFLICTGCGLARPCEHKVESRKQWADLLVHTHNRARDLPLDSEATYVPAAMFDQLVQDVGEDALVSAKQIGEYKRRLVDALDCSGFGCVNLCCCEGGC